MQVWRFLLIVIASCLGAALPLAAQQGADNSAQSIDNRPNIIFFLVDDLGWQDTSVAFGEPTGVQQHFRTPNLERLAASRVRVSNAYSCSVCTPTRASIMTGQNAARHRITNWTLHQDRETSGKTDRLEAPREWRREGLQPGDPFLARILRDGGYTTIHCGKAHWGAIDTPGSNPLQIGFDVNIAGHAAGAPGSYQGKKNFGNEADGKRKMPWGVPDLEHYHGTETHLTDALTIEAEKALETAVAKRKPFFLWMAHYAVHTPIEPHGRFLDGYTNRTFADTEIKIEPKEAQYASMVAGIDASLGALLQQLEKLGVAENTLIVFTSDNGGLSAHARQTTWQGTGANSHNWPLREGKGSAYEGGTRVPLIISWAKAANDSANQRKFPIAANQKIEVPVICEDHFPTLLRVAGVTTENSHSKIDGRDYSEYLTPNAAKQVSQNEDRELVFHYPHVWGPKGAGYQPHSSIRVGDWKAIYFYQSQTWELYDLGRDLSETNDQASTEPIRLGEMARRLLNNLRAKDALWPYDFVAGRDEPIQLPR